MPNVPKVGRKNRLWWRTNDIGKFQCLQVGHLHVISLALRIIFVMGTRHKIDTKKMSKEVLWLFLEKVSVFLKEP
jgi:hypothetical protein